MNASAPIPATVGIRRTRLVGPIAMVAAIAAAVIWATPARSAQPVTSFTSLTPAQLAAVACAHWYANPVPVPVISRARVASPVTSLTPAQLAAVACTQWYAKLGRTARGVAPPSSAGQKTARRVPAASLTPYQLAAVEWARGFGTLGRARVVWGG